MCNLCVGSTCHLPGVSRTCRAASPACRTHERAIGKVMSFLLSLVEWDIEPSKCLFISGYLIVVIFLNCQLKVRDKLQPASDWKAPLTQLDFFPQGMIYYLLTHTGSPGNTSCRESKGKKSKYWNQRPAGLRFAGGTFFSAYVAMVDPASWLVPLVLRGKRNSCALCHSRRNKCGTEQTVQPFYLFLKYSASPVSITSHF